MSEEKSAGPNGKELAISDLTSFGTLEKPSRFAARAFFAGGAFLAETMMPGVVINAENGPYFIILIGLWN
jgi:hypothetical protein